MVHFSLLLVGWLLNICVSPNGVNVGQQIVGIILADLVFVLFPVPRHRDLGNQLWAAISSNLPQELPKIIEYAAAAGLVGYRVSSQKLKVPIGAQPALNLFLQPLRLALPPPKKAKTTS